MVKITKPYKSAGKRNRSITQGFHDKHKALDMIVPRKSSYGEPLVAPEDVEIVRIVGDTYTPEDTTNLKRGYGIFMLGMETGFYHQYWHTLPILPVSVGQKVKRGKIVAFMGNAGKVYSGGGYVAVGDRLLPEKPGTHLHYEMYDSYDPSRHKKGIHVDPRLYIDWDLPVTYTYLDLLKATSVVLAKTLNLMRG